MELQAAFFHVENLKRISSYAIKSEWEVKLLSEYDDDGCS